MRSNTHWLWVLLFISPYLVLLFKLGEFGIPPLPEFTQVLKDAGSQAFFSALLSVTLGLLGALSLLRWSTQGVYGYLRTFVTLPSFIPPIFVALSMITLLEHWSHFPFGFWGVVLIHVVVNGGLCAVIIEKLLRSKIGGMWELALVEGGRKWMFVYHGVIRFLARDLWSIFIFVFALGFTGFTIPLLAGQVQPLSLSVYLFDKLRLEGDWGQALFLAVFESLVLFAFAFIKTHSIKSLERRLSIDVLRHLSIPVFNALIVFIAIIVIFGDISAWGKGAMQIISDTSIQRTLYAAAMMSLAIGFGVGILIFVLMSLLVGLSFRPQLFRFFNFYSSPSPVFLGFVIILTFPPSAPRSLLLVGGLGFLFFPMLFRMYGRSLVEPLKMQIETAQIIGASRSLIFKKVLFPQIVRPLCWLSGVASFWAAGDFALSRILLGQDSTLALLVESLMGSYRLEMATTVSLLMLLVGMVSLLLFIGIGHVTYKKLV
ncbi:MAG: ABC transporter permease subunit [Bdellovibrionales bacterium]